MLVKTKGEGGQYPAWELGAEYEKGEKVSHARADWECIQKHTAHVGEWAPGMGDEVFWKKLP
uniref:carbohydrate-binding protein n=1 Tax=Pseudomonas migulae TaxID=78543 RepID=UPI003B846312